MNVTPFTSCRWRKEFGGLKGDQVKRLKDLEKENERLRKAGSDLTLEKLILREAALANCLERRPASPLHRPRCEEAQRTRKAGVSRAGAEPIDAEKGTEGAAR